MTSRIALAAALASSLLGTLAASPAFAQESTTPPPAAIEGTAQPAKKLALGVQLELLPVGSMDVTFSGPVLNGSDSTGTSTAFGLGATFGYDITPNISIGAAPRLILNVQGETAKESAKEFDLRARVAVHGEVAPQLQLYGYAAPGYTWVIPPNSDINSTGPAIGFGGGVAYDVSPDLFVNAELGYQIAYLSAESQGTTVDVDLSYLHIGLGGGTRF